MLNTQLPFRNVDKTIQVLNLNTQKNTSNPQVHTEQKNTKRKKYTKQFTENKSRKALN